MQIGRADRKVSFEFPKPQTNPTYGTDGPIQWERLLTCMVEWQDAMPSRQETTQQGIVTRTNQVRLRMRWRADITSDMHVINHSDGDSVWQIIGGPAAIGGRQTQIELVLERYSS